MAQAMNTAQMYATLRSQTPLTEYESLMYESLCNFINEWTKLQKTFVLINQIEADRTLKAKAKEEQTELEGKLESSPDEPE